jgi:hypothetical protein
MITLNLRTFILYSIVSFFSVSTFAFYDFILEPEAPPIPTQTLSIASVSPINQSYSIGIPYSSSANWYELWESQPGSSYVKVYSNSVVRWPYRTSNKIGYVYYYYNVCHTGGCSRGPTSKIRIYSAPSKPTNIQLSPTSIYNHELNASLKLIIDPETLEELDTSSAYPKLTWNISGSIESSIGYYQIIGTFNGTQISDEKFDSNVSQINVITDRGIGSYAYKIRACNGSSLCSAWTSKPFTIKNSNPIMTKDYFYIDEDSNSIILPLLNNDLDKDGHQLAVTEVNSATLGTTWISNNTVYYRPNSNSHGTDELSYTVSDGNGGEATGDATVKINSVNDQPIANDDSITINEDTANTPIYILSNDSDVDNDLDYNQVVVVTPPSYGTIQNNNDSINYTPGENYDDNDEFTYKIKDGSGKEDTAVVSIIVNPVNDPPVISGSAINKVCLPDKYYFKPSATDVDNKSEDLTFQISGKPNWATFDISTGELIGTPNNSNIGKYNDIVVSVSDGSGSTELAPFTIEVMMECDVKTIMFIHTDLLGSPTIETNENGEVK